MDGTRLGLIVVCALAAARSWRLFALDDAGQPVRRALHWLIRPLPERARDVVWEGWFCPFCLGFWLAAGWWLTGLAWADAWQWQAAAGTMAVSYLAGLLGSRLDAD